MALTVETSDIESARELARAARAAYPLDAASPCATWAGQFPKHIPFHRASTYGVLLADTSRVILAFRGRQRDESYGIGLACDHVPFLGGGVHRGYFDALDSIWNPMLAALYDTNALDKTLWLTGHSGGGCMALIAAERLSTLGFEPHLVITYGSPRCLDPIAAAACRTRHIRIINAGDFVPSLVWPTVRYDYAHSGTAFELFPGGAIRSQNRHARVVQALDRLDALEQKLLGGPTNSPHAMDSYIERLDRAVEHTVSIGQAVSDPAR